MEQQAVELGKHNLEQISLMNPVMGLLLLILFVSIVVLAVVVYKLSGKIGEMTKKLDEKNDKMYNEAKADLALVLAFEKKLDIHLSKDELIINNTLDIKSTVNEIKSYIEFINNNKTSR